MSENKINGGSYRIYCKKNLEKSIKYKENSSYKEIIKFIKRVKKNKIETLNFIKNKTKLGKKYFSTELLLRVIRYCNIMV